MVRRSHLDRRPFPSRILTGSPAGRSALRVRRGIGRRRMGKMDRCVVMMLLLCGPSLVFAEDTNDERVRTSESRKVGAFGAEVLARRGESASRWGTANDSFHSRYGGIVSDSFDAPVFIPRGRGDVGSCRSQRYCRRNCKECRKPGGRRDDSGQGTSGRLCGGLLFHCNG
jgi:hypothetical protein